MISTSSGVHVVKINRICIFLAFFCFYFPVIFCEAAGDPKKHRESLEDMVLGKEKQQDEGES